jgi:hypothetical protein
MEWKVIQIDFLDLGGFSRRDQKAKALGELNVDEVLVIQFNKRDKYRKGTIRNWINKVVTPQLQGYVTSEEIREQVGGRELRAHLVLVVGSRQLLVWDMDGNGKWIGRPELV